MREQYRHNLEFLGNVAPNEMGGLIPSLEPRTDYQNDVNLGAATIDEENGSFAHQHYSAERCGRKNEARE